MASHQFARTMHNFINIREQNQEPFTCKSVAVFHHNVPIILCGTSVFPASGAPPRHLLIKRRAFAAGGIPAHGADVTAQINASALTRVLTPRAD